MSDEELQRLEMKIAKLALQCCKGGFIFGDDMKVMRPEKVRKLEDALEKYLSVAKEETK